MNLSIQHRTGVMLFYALCHDIETILWKIEEQQQKSKFLQEQRDKCSVGSEEYFKWQDKLTVVDDKVWKLDKQRKRAEYMVEEAKRKLA